MTNDRVFRGGSWFNDAATSLAARYRLAPSDLVDDLGFRCVQQSTPETSRTNKGGGCVRSSPAYRSSFNPYYNLGVLRFRAARRMEKT